jgi:hypothetical protein
LLPSDSFFFEQHLLSLEPQLLKKSLLPEEFLLLLNDFLSDPDLRCHHLLWVPRENRVVPVLRHGQGVLNSASKDGLSMTLVKLKGESGDLLEGQLSNL